MKLVVSDANKKYELSFGQLTQLCGINIPLKTFIIDSISKHFSSEKYKEYEEKLIENITLDGEIPGRKQWECTRIRNRDDIISTIQMNKSSILGKCLKESINGFDCQRELLLIDEVLLKIFSQVNNTLIDNDIIELQYVQEDLFSMIQQTSVKTKDGRDIHELSIDNLLDVFLDIIIKQQELIPEKRIYILENLDHLLSCEGYYELVSRCFEMTRDSNIWFVLSTSLPQYMYVSEGLIEDINIINDDIFSLPSMEHILDFIRVNYPVEREVTIVQLADVVRNIGQEIGVKSTLLEVHELIILKLLNESLGVKSKWVNEPKAPEIQCLIG